MLLFLCTVLVLLTFLRAEHLLAGIFWMGRHGRACYEELDYLHVSDSDPPELVWPVYESHRAGRLPYLFFAVKSYRLYIWSRMTGSFAVRVRAVAAGITRPLWRLYTFVLWVTATIVLMTVRPAEMTGLAGVFALTSALLLLLSSVLIAVEGAVSNILLRSWGHRHHRLRPWNSAGAAEVGAVLVAALCALVSSLAVIQVAATRFGAYTGHGPEDSFADRIGFSGLQALHAVHFGAAATVGGVGGLVEAALVVLWLFYAVVLVTVFGTFVRT